MLKKKQLKIVYLVFVLGLVFLVDKYADHALLETPKSGVDETAGGSESQNKLIRDAFENHRSDVQVRGRSVVIRVLSDDNEGSRHQRILLRISPEQTILIAHNIDLAPRLNSLRKGDVLEFYGEYEWNSQGGVVHWTHRDPRSKHVHGWLKHEGVVYE